MRLPICLLHIILFGRFLFICFWVTYSVWGPRSDPACLRGPGLGELWKHHIPLGCTPHTGSLSIEAYGSQTMTVNNPLIIHIPFYFWLEQKSTMFLRRPSWQSPDPGEQYSPDISSADKMLTRVLRCAYNIHEGREAHKLANLPLKKNERTDCCPPISLRSRCDTVCLLYKCFKTQRRPAPNKQHTLVTSYKRIIKKMYNIHGGKHAIKGGKNFEDVT